MGALRAWQVNLQVPNRNQRSAPVKVCTYSNGTAERR